MCVLPKVTGTAHRGCFVTVGVEHTAQAGGRGGSRKLSLERSLERIQVSRPRVGPASQ